MAISLVGAIVPRTTQNIYPPGEQSTFQTINLQTQLQFSTLGVATSTFYRFVSSSDGWNGTVTPGQEYIVSSIIAPGTVCIRSFSDPMNLANPSTFTSTVQSFGYWVPVPQQPVTFSTVTGDFVVRSTLTAYRANISTSLSVLGAFYAGSISSGGAITATGAITSASSITATGGITAGGNLVVSGTGTVTGTFGAGFVTTNTLNTVALSATGTANINILNANFISTPNVQTTNVVTSTLVVSSINGAQFNPGGVISNGLFSTLRVSSLASISTVSTTSLTTTTTTTTALNFINAIGTAANIGGVSISSQTLTAQDLITSSIIGQVGLFQPPGGGTGFTLITGQNIQTSNVQTSSLSYYYMYGSNISTQGINISSINDQPYPPPFNSTVIGNFNITSTLNVYQIISQTSIGALGSITAASNLTANGNIIGSNIEGTSLTSLTSIVAATSIRAANGVIGNVIVGPSGTVSGKAFSASTLNTSGGIVCGGPLTVAFPNTINGTSINVTELKFVSSINNEVYPPFIPSGSTFNQIFTSSIKASTIYSYQTYTSTLNASTITASTMNLPGIFMNLNGPSGTIGATVFSGANGIFGNMNLGAGGNFSGPLGSMTISSVNNLQITPNPNYSTLVVSSSALIGGFLTASGASIGGSQFINGGISTTSTITVLGALTAGTGNIGGVTFTGSGIANASLVTAPIFQASVSVSAPLGNFTTLNTNIISTPTISVSTITGASIINLVSSLTIGNNLVVPRIYTSKVFSDIIDNTGLVSTATLETSTIKTNVMTFNDAPVPDPNGIYGGASFQMIVSTSTYVSSSVTYPYNQTTVAPGYINLALYGGVGGTTLFPAQITTPTLNVVDVNATGNVVAGSISTTNLNASNLTVTPGNLYAQTQYSGFNQYNTPTIGNESNTNFLPANPGIAGLGNSQYMTATTYISGRYYRAGSLSVNTPVEIPNLFVNTALPCFIRLLCQSTDNLLPSSPYPALQRIFGAWDIFVGKGSQPSAGQPFTDVVQTDVLTTSNCYINEISSFGIGGPGCFQFGIGTTINSGFQPSKIYYSWNVQVCPVGY